MSRRAQETPFDAIFDYAKQVAASSASSLRTGSLGSFGPTTSAQLAGVITDETGTGALVFATSPTLVAPVLGAATATSVNLVSLTQPATGATITLADSTTLTTQETVIVAGKADFRQAFLMMGG